MRYFLDFEAGYWRTIFESEPLDQAKEINTPSGILQILCTTPDIVINTSIGAKLTQYIEDVGGTQYEIKSQWIRLNSWILSAPNQNFEYPSKWKIIKNPRLTSALITIKSFHIGNSDQLDRTTEKLSLQIEGLESKIDNIRQTVEQLYNHLIT